jgi:hypothetical protein
MKKIVSMLALLGLSVLVVGCSHPIKIIGEGDVTSGTGNRACLLEDYQQGLSNCTKNNVYGAYNETYYGVPRPGWRFHRWASYCVDATNNECEFHVPANAVKSYWGQTVPPLVAIYRPLVNTGFDVLFMGHSRFFPIAAGMPFHVGPTGQAGFPNHTQSSFEAGGVLGSPQELWNNTTTRAAIQAQLNTGNIDLLGMTYHYDAPGMEGYRNWVSYALSKNPDTRFFIGMPQPWYPADYDSATYEAIWNSEHVVAHTIIDTLRAEFPHVDFFCIPYGQSAVELHKLHSVDNLPDVDYLVKPDAPSTIVPDNSSVFWDNSFSHPNQILIDLSELVWLRAIYGVDLSTYNDGSAYTTDLKAIATDITDSHDPDYNAPY